MERLDDVMPRKRRRTWNSVGRIEKDGVERRSVLYLSTSVAECRRGSLDREEEEEDKQEEDLIKTVRQKLRVQFRS